MANVKVKFRPSSVASHYGTIYYQIIHRRKVRHILSNFKIDLSEWDETRSMVVINPQSERKTILIHIREQIHFDIESITRIIKTLDQKWVEYSADDIIDEYKRFISEYTLFRYMGIQILKLKEKGKTRTSETYQSALDSFRKLNEGEDLLLDCITSDVMKAYEAWLKSRGISFNTISFYMRILRAVYNRAVEADIIEDKTAFKHVYTGICKTQKRALPLGIIRKIKDLDLYHTPALGFARDMFMMSFYLRGMSFIDMAFLKKTDLRNGYVTYRRRKTHQQLTIEWTEEMQDILDKYPVNKSDYLLPIIRNQGNNELYTYRNVSYNINRNLKTIANTLGIAMPLTLYVARHSWASAAKTKGVPLSVISEGMGHNNETTTQIYLASLDTFLVDKANSLILNSLK